MASLLFQIVILLGVFLPSAAGVWRNSPQKAPIVGQNRTFGTDRSSDFPNPLSAKPPLLGDFPEYRPGAREAGRETFWR
jgi:hypothetical protein